MMIKRQITMKMEIKNDTHLPEKDRNAEKDRSDDMCGEGN